MSEVAGAEMMTLARAVALDQSHAKLRWEALSLVASRTPFAPTISALTGFVYLDNGMWLLAPTTLETVADGFAEVIVAMTAPGDPGWVRCLFQITWPEGKTRFVFERDDVDRWPVGTHGSDAQAEALRPDLL